ncbi:thioesterase family protein [Alteribacillus sp. YIM 98480]|uniref:acyl-CoA thioesterase n=1 Tax=Alteribacillus sp. YIM 98480 TaxID=2606599 RepID=UPI00131A6F5A|nr:acyl-CoA thioesterase [Alteribacillus sp. YIM 98480]
MITNTEVEVKEEDIDEVGHVNNSVFVSYLEKGRGHWYREAGLSFADMAEQNLGTVVVRLDISFQKEARLGEQLQINTKPVKIGKKSFTFEQTIINEKEEVILEGTVINVMFDKEARKSIAIAKEIIQCFP